MATRARGALRESLPITGVPSSGLVTDGDGYSVNLRSRARDADKQVMRHHPSPGSWIVGVIVPLQSDAFETARSFLLFWFEAPALERLGETLLGADEFAGAFGPGFP